MIKPAFISLFSCILFLGAVASTGAQASPVVDCWNEDGLSVTAGPSPGHQVCILHEDSVYDWFWNWWFGFDN